MFIDWFSTWLEFPWDGCNWFSWSKEIGCCRDPDKSGCGVGVGSNIFCWVLFSFELSWIKGGICLFDEGAAWGIGGWALNDIKLWCCVCISWEGCADDGGGGGRGGGGGGGGGVGGGWGGRGGIEACWNIRGWGEFLFWKFPTGPCWLLNS